MTTGAWWAPPARSPAEPRLGRISRLPLPLFVAGVCVAVVAVRLTYVFQPLRFDEAGYLFVARHWDSDGPFLFGEYWVDRPPGLLLIFRLAALFDTSQAVRAVAIPFALLFIVAAARTARVIAGRRAARLGTVIAAALVTTPATGSDQADGELFAAPLVMAAVALVLEARHRTTKAGWFLVGTASGACAMAAPMVKQSFLEAILFAVVLLAFSQHGRRRRRAGLPWIAGGTALGAALPIAALLGWTFLAPFALADAWSQLVEFRTTALSTILADPTTSMVRRGSLLILLATVSGILPILVLMARPDARRQLTGSPLGRAVVAVALYGVAAVVVGGSYWPHYLLQLAPAMVLGTALLASDPPRERWLRPVCLGAAGTAVAASMAMAVFYATSPSGWWPQRTGAWLHASSVPGDTAVVLYGAAAVQQSSGLESPYPYLWSLPVRVHDPDLDHLQTTLRGPSAPTWIVQPLPLNSWDIDEDRELREQLNASYRIVADVCGAPVWLREGLTRDLAETPAC